MTNEQQRITNVFYLAFVLWREARAEIREGKVALVFSILDRVDHPKWWGSDVISVITKPWQYSSMTDPKDPQLTKYPSSDATWVECLQVAMDVYDGKITTNPAPTADSYYATWMDTTIDPKTGKPMTPPWAAKAKFIAKIGNHKFFNTDGDHPENVQLGIDLTT